MSLSPAMFSSASAEWGTPHNLFRAVDRICGPFTLDVCASPSNAKCAVFYSIADDCMVKPWCGRWWCNPVYGNPEEPCGPHDKCKKKRCVARGYHVDAYQPGCIDFVRRGVEQVVADPASSGVFLVPARTDTEWFGTLFAAADQVLFLRGRLYFDGPSGESAPAPFPSALVSICRNPPKSPFVGFLDTRSLRA